MAYCTGCGKKVKKINSGNLCKECSDKRNKEIEEESKKFKQREKELKNKIIKEFEINSKIREIEKILKSPCMIQVDVANAADWSVFLFGRFTKRKFKVQPLVKNMVVSKLEGEYKDIDSFCKRARRKGFKAKMWSDTEVSLLYKDEEYIFLSDGIYKNLNKTGIFSKVPYDKVADVKYELWKGKRA